MNRENDGTAEAEVVG